MIIKRRKDKGGEQNTVEVSDDKKCVNVIQSPLERGESCGGGARVYCV